ncbi:MAG TPA: glycerol acyltransferase [Saprospiraceae bacterium]|nr:glycerol acyltransferase [Saprospiraceae bacterium]HND89550.1 glycerol acyltransferase [Saprospiraceae bacterium]HNG90022.1 glycerol acyltransferase [Saprospiraceae bacterium]
MNYEKGLSIYTDEEARAAVQELFGYESLLRGMQAHLPPALCAYILRAKDEVHSVLDFQTKIAHPLFKAVEQASIIRLTTSGFEHLDPSRQYLFISNHRDIILDSAYLNIVLFEHAFPTSQIAIGDNLMRHRISELIFHINKSFVVRRSGTPMELYRYSLQLSDYIRRQIGEKRDSVWIAQREGRAKDGDDRTQTGLLKMLSLSAADSLKAHFRQLNLVPVAISYEYDPCDLLKAQEFLNKRADPAYKKTFEEDVQHMLLGLKGPKGHVHFHFGDPIDAELEAFDHLPGTKKQLEALASWIDHSIHRHYRLWPVNYVAHDLLTDSHDCAAHYSPEERTTLEAFFQTRCDCLRHDAEGLGRDYLLRMYANPVLNQMTAQTKG